MRLVQPLLTRHEVVQNAYLTLSPGTVGLGQELTADRRLPAGLIRALDRNGDKQITRRGTRLRQPRVSSRNLSSRRPPARDPTLSVDVPSYAALLGAHGTIRIVAVAPRPTQRGSQRWRIAMATARRKAAAMPIFSSSREVGGRSHTGSGP